MLNTIYNVLWHRLQALVISSLARTNLVISSTYIVTHPEQVVLVGDQPTNFEHVQHFWRHPVSAWWFGVLRFNASATARVISRRWNDDDEISFLVEETGVSGGNHRPTASNWWKCTCCVRDTSCWARVVRAVHVMTSRSDFRYVHSTRYSRCTRSVRA